MSEANIVPFQWPGYAPWAQQVCTTTHLLDLCLIISTDEDQGLEAQAISDYQSQAGNGGSEESGSFPEGTLLSPSIAALSEGDSPLQDMHHNPRNSHWTPSSPGPVDVNRLALVALEHVSMASWQPHLRLI